MSDILARTAPLRERLRAQHETGRIFPELDPDLPLGIAELYPRVTGNPVVCIDDPETTALLAAYRQTWDVDRLDDIARRQSALYARGASLHPTVAVFASRTRQDGMPWCDTQTGEPVGLGRRFSRNGMRVRVAGLEAFLRTKKATKLSDLTPFASAWKSMRHGWAANRWLDLPCLAVPTGVRRRPSMICSYL